MISVISIGEFLGGALKYNLDKVKEGDAEIIGSAHCICNTLDGVGKDINENQINRSFAPYLEANNRTKNVVFSCSLNPHPDEAKNIDNETFLEIAKDYMNGMGYGNQPYIVVKHEDIERPHIHIVSVRVDANGKKLNDSMEKARSNRVRQEIEQKYGLMTTNESSIAETREVKAERVEQYIERNKLLAGETEDKKKIKSILMFVCDHYKPQDMVEYNKILRQFLLTCKELDVENLQGYKVRGCQYVKMDSNGKEEGIAYKASLFGKQASIEGLRFYFEKSKQYNKEREVAKQDVRVSIDNALAIGGISSIYALSTILKRNGIEVNFHCNREGRVTGLSFVDNATGYTFKGSELGKGYSVNVLQKKASEDRKLAMKVKKGAEANRNLKLGEVDIKKKIEAVLKEVRSRYTPQNMEEYNKILSNYKVCCIEINGKGKNGEEYRGCRYSLVGEKGTAIGHALSGSLFGREYSLNGLERRFQRIERLSEKDKSEILSEFRRFYGEERRANYFESDVLAKLPSMMGQLVAIATQIKPTVKQSVLERLAKEYIDGKRRNFKKIEEKENSYVKSQMQHFIRFATLLSAEKRRRFLWSVDIKVEGVGCNMRFSHVKKPSYSFSWQDVVTPINGEKVSLNPILPLSVPMIKEEKERLGKKEKEVAKAFVLGDWGRVDLKDRRESFFRLKQLLGDKERSELQTQQNDAQAKDLMAKFAIFGAEKMVGEMLTRGLVIIPAKRANGERTYVVGNTQTNITSFVEVSANIKKELDRLRYASKIYPSVKNFVFGKSGKPTIKHLIASSIATARDYSDFKMVDRIVERVNRFNPDLAEMMKTYMGEKIDYDGMMNVVLRYRGEHFEEQNVNYFDALKKVNNIGVINSVLKQGRKNRKG